MKLFATDKKESRESKLYRWGCNIWPCIWCAGGKVEFVSADFKELHVGLSLNWRTNNRVNTIFGGSIYSSIDPYFMLMLMKILGKDYVVWDKGATVKFLRPITQKVKCRFLLDDGTIEDVKRHIELRGEYTFDLPLHYEGEDGKVYATFTKTMYTASKDFYKKKVAARQAA